MPETKFGANRMNRSEVITFLSLFPVSSAAILDFEKCHFWPLQFLGGAETKLHVKFGENRTNGSKVIKVFVKFKMAAGGHLVFQISWFPVTRSLRMWSWCCKSNLVKIGLMVQKLSTFFFPIGNALRVPQNWGFWGFWGWKLKILFF